MSRTTPFMLTSFPRAILHIDGDAFFASVEQAIHPELKGKPVVTGKERGIIACASYEAKAIGIKRGLPLFENIYEAGVNYRTTTVILDKLEPDENVQPDLFEDNIRVEKLSRMSKTVDAINARFGKHTVSLASSLFLRNRAAVARAERPIRKTTLLAGETDRCRLNLPRLFVNV